MQERSLLYSPRVFLRRPVHMYCFRLNLAYLKALELQFPTPCAKRPGMLRGAQLFFDLQKLLRIIANQLDASYRAAISNWKQYRNLFSKVFSKACDSSRFKFGIDASI